MKKIIFKILFLSFFLLLPLNTYAYDETDYVIENYDVNIVVNENHVLKVTEKLKINYTTSMHGFVRTIPAKTVYKRVYNNRPSEFRSEAIISNIKVNDTFKKTREYDEYNIRIGNPYKKVKGIKDYVITYDYDLGDDGIDKFDDLYYNIIGTDWETIIKNASFSITMPKEFDASLLNFTIGNEGSLYNKDVDYQINNNVIKGKVIPHDNDSYALASYEGVTIRLQLPEGYFINETKNDIDKGYYEDDYYISSYKVNAKVNENHVVRVNNIIDFELKDGYDGYGVYLNIPKNKKIKVNNKEYKTRGYVSNIISSNEDYSLSQTEDYYLLRVDIPKSEKTFHYEISYDYDMGDDLIDEYDYLALLIDENIPVKNLSFNIEMPKSFDQYLIDSKLEYYSDIFDVVDYNVNGNIISGTVKDDINGNSLSNEDFHFFIKLPEGYFINETPYKLISQKIYYNMDDDFTINDYKVDVNVNENHILNITEELSITNYHSKISDLRLDIPYKSTFNKKVNGKYELVKDHTIISNLKSDYNIDKYNYKDSYRIKLIDNEDIYSYDELTKVKISYDYDMGDDLIDEYDDLNLYLFGKYNEYNILNGSFKITMPKSFNEKNIKFIGLNDINYEVNNNIIEGSIEPDLDGISIRKKENVRINIELPEGYYVSERPYVDKTKTNIIIFIVVSILVFLIEFYFFKLYGLMPKEAIVTKFEAPDGLLPSEVGYIYRKRVNNKQIISLITYFANKGFLEINEITKHKFELVKLKDIDEKLPKHAITTFNGLFKKRGTNKVTNSQLKNSFYKTLEEALSELKSSKTIYEFSHYVLYIAFVSIMAALLFCFLVIKTSFTYKINYEYKNIYLFSLVVLITIEIINMLFIIFNRKMKEKTNKQYFLILGFRDFILNVKKEQLEELVEKNPNIYFDVLPYAYVLNVSDKWSKKFESIIFKEPDWYSTNEKTFENTHSFMNNLNRTLKTVNAAASSRPYETSSRSYSGGSSFGGSDWGGSSGGSSGGGAGGGGGHGW